MIAHLASIDADGALADEDFDALVAPDAKLPGSEFPTESGERRLLLALLEDQLRLASGHGTVLNGTHAKRERALATAWLASDAYGSRDALGWTFRDVCDHLGLAPDPIRAALAAGRALTDYRQPVRHMRVEAA